MALEERWRCDFCYSSKKVLEDLIGLYRLPDNWYELKLRGKHGRIYTWQFCDAECLSSFIKDNVLKYEETINE